MRERVTAACVQVEPVIFDRSATIDRVAEGVGIGPEPEWPAEGS